MKVSSSRRFADLTDPSKYIGTHITYRQRLYELAGIVAIGMEKIVFVMKDLKSGRTPYALRVFREKMTPAEFKQYQRRSIEFMNALYERTRNAKHFELVRDPPPDYCHIGDRAVDVVRFHNKPTLAELENHFAAADDAQLIDSVTKADDTAALLNLCNKRLRQNPLDPQWLCVKGWAQYSNRDWIGAERTLRRCVAVVPSDAPAYLMLGGVLMNQGRPAEALRVAAEATRYSEDGHTWLELARLNCHAMRPDSARECLRNCRGSLSRTKEYRRERARVNALDRRIRRLARRMNFLGKAYAAGQTGTAIGGLRALSAQHPLCAGIWLLLGQLLLGEEQHREAASVLGTAYAIDDNQDVRLLLGYAEYGNEDVSHAFALHSAWAVAYWEEFAQIVGNGMCEPSEARIVVPRDGDVLSKRAHVIEECKEMRGLYPVTILGKGVRRREAVRSFRKLIATLSTSLAELREVGKKANHGRI